MAVVRISKGRFGVEKLAEIEQLLAAAEAALREPLQELKGLVHYYVGIDRELGYLTNVSVWETLEDAHQMDSLQPMLALRPSFEENGASFETITNHETLWTITP
jgi:hypothetical protein